jgi:hypothetical protein
VQLKSLQLHGDPATSLSWDRPLGLSEYATQPGVAQQTAAISSAHVALPLHTYLVCGSWACWSPIVLAPAWVALSKAENGVVAPSQSGL